MTEEDTFAALKKQTFNSLLVPWNDRMVDHIEFLEILTKAVWTWGEFANICGRMVYV